MKLQVTVPLAVLLSVCTSAPILQPRLGIIASNSNEVLRVNGITLAGVGMGQAQGAPFLSPFLIQTQPEILLPPQFLNFGPQLPGPFLPPQQNHAPMPPNQQEQQTALNPNNPPLNQNPVQ
uniref:Apin n=1 Tax=Pygocentrus nattereri TaxID=42514 RepID=A0AAR2J1Y9_PYGNA